MLYCSLRQGLLKNCPTFHTAGTPFYRRCAGPHAFYIMRCSKLPSLPLVRTVLVAPALQRYVKGLGGQLSLAALECGGGGDCLFHAVGAGLEAVREAFPETRASLGAYCPAAPGAKGRGEVVGFLRGFVADTFRAMPPEELLNFVMAAANQERSPGWQDKWSPRRVLADVGLSVLAL